MKLLMLIVVACALFLAACHPIAGPASGTCHGEWDANGTLTKASCSWDPPTTTMP